AQRIQWWSRNSCCLQSSYLAALDTARCCGSLLTLSRPLWPWDRLQPSNSAERSSELGPCCLPQTDPCGPREEGPPLPLQFPPLPTQWPSRTSVLVPPWDQLSPTSQIQGR